MLRGRSRAHGRICNNVLTTSRDYNNFDESKKLTFCIMWFYIVPWKNYHSCSIEALMMAMGLILYFCDPSNVNLSVKQSTLFPGWGVLSYMSGYACA